MSFIWWEQNGWTFEGRELTMEDLKQLYLIFFESTKAVKPVSSLSFHDSIVILKLHRKHFVVFFPQIYSYILHVYEGQTFFLFSMKFIT